MTMRTTRLQLNSAALWWFCRNLSAEERANILGEYVKVQALTGGATPAVKSPPASESGGKRPAGSRRRKVAGGG